MLYIIIKDIELLFDGLVVEIDYIFKICFVNKDGYLDWVEFGVKIKVNLLEFVFYGIKGEIIVKNQEGFDIDCLFDFVELGDMWYMKYGVKVLFYDMIIDLRIVNQLDKFEYLLCIDGGNGMILKGIVYYSMDKENWIEVGVIDWKCNGDVKVFIFIECLIVCYIKLVVIEGVNNYGLGRELYVFKVFGIESCLQGDINNDGKIDNNDLILYINYIGLRKGDFDYEGYISVGDIDQNGLIDVYDIFVVVI